MNKLEYTLPPSAPKLLVGGYAGTGPTSAPASYRQSVVVPIGQATAGLRLEVMSVSNVARAVAGGHHHSARVGHAVPKEIWLSGPELAAPVLAIASVEDDVWVAVEPETGIFGAGTDLDGARDDLRAALRDHFDLLTAEEHLSEELQRQKAFLANLLVAA